MASFYAAAPPVTGVSSAQSTAGRHTPGAPPPSPMPLGLPGRCWVSSDFDD